jgi:hypothetical protein
MNILPNGIELIRLADVTPGRDWMRSSTPRANARVRSGSSGVALGQRHSHGLHDAVAPGRFEAGRRRRETHEAVNQQARADQEDERESHSVSWGKPLDLLAGENEDGDWRAVWDEFRPWLVTAA